MKESPNLNTCTAEEFADWLQHVKEEQGVVMHHTGFYTYDQLYTLAEAFRIFGQREGYKKGKRDGSRRAYRIGHWDGYLNGYDVGYNKGYEDCQKGEPL